MDIYSAHRTEVWTLARRMVRNDADADDVVAATFETLPRALRNFEQQSELRSFVLGVCANVARRFRRSISRRTALIDRFGAEPISVAAEDPEATFSRQQSEERVASLLSSLPEEQRVAFTLMA